MSLEDTSSRNRQWGGGGRFDSINSTKSLLFLMLTLLLLPCLTLAQNYKATEIPSHSPFLNYGQKKIKPGPEIENEIVKSKVEVLGEILKRHVQGLRQVPDQRLELVFLVDSSASVGAEHFFNEIKFVKKLLADFAVSYNQTRVAVITFSSKNKVIRHIDHVTQASQDNHKCSLLEQELPRIRYSGGGTYTLGALLEAQSVIALARPDSIKAVFLVTDGYSNGGNPRSAAAFLQARGVRIFTFGIRNGNVKELYDMASEPKEEHSYILDSFEEFEALARRALHEDLHSGVLMEQNPRACSDLCSGTMQYCCDTYATCTCGTHTGRYDCTCRKGYYGGGLRGDCRPCPAGRYKDRPGPGDMSSCHPCPDPNMMSVPGSTSPNQCYCKGGYIQVGLKCQMMQCPVLVPPENGYFVRNSCNNVVNAACGVRCDPGYTLQGSSIRLCGQDGVWSGGDAQCVMKSCPVLRAPNNGTMVCSQDHPTMDTQCHFTCKPGFQLVGSKMRTCLPVAMWDGIPVYCKSISCRAVTPLRNGEVIPSSCTTAKSRYNTQCDFSCDPGYQLSGPSKTTCVDPGVWSGGRRTPRCVDVTPPELKCPENQTVSMEQHESYAVVTWDDPVVQDNSGGPVKMATIPATTNPMKLSIGTHTITYLAKDKLGNRASCQFSITVVDDEVPRVDWCDSPPIFLSHEEDVDVYWEEPIFSDNSGEEVHVTRSMDPGHFPQGDTLVEYKAQDSAGNTQTCNITITVQKHACQLPVDPINGAANCTEDPEAIFCTLTCHNGYAFAMRPQQDYFCAYDGVWLPDDNPIPFPDCSVTSVSNSISQSGEVAMEDDGSVCDDIFLMGQVENQLEKRLEEALNAMCNEDVVCEVAAVEAVCESILSEAEESFNRVDFYRRKKRSVEDEVEGALASFWPISDDDGRWIYWTRSPSSSSAATTKVKRVRRNIDILHDFDDFEDTLRHKRQFGFSLDHLIRGPSDIAEETEVQNSSIRHGDEDRLGVLLDLISHSMASDLGFARFSSFLSSLQPQNGSFTSDDFMSAFSEEFGEEKAAALHELASTNLHQLNPFGSTYNSTWGTLSLRNISQSSDYDSHAFSNSTSGQIATTTRRAFKVHFKVEGHGSGATEQLDSALSELVRVAGEGQLDVNYGERQLRVAAIRLREHPEYICEAGSVVREEQCVKCPVGTFFHVVLRECLACPQGSFQPEEGQVSCIVCPTNTSTKAGNAKSNQECKAQCLPGTFSKDGLEPCTTCEIGSYQDEYASDSCASCPYGTTTWRRATWQIEECQPECEAGQVSETGLSPCYSCPRGYFQVQTGQMECLRCPEESDTPSTGTTSMFDCEGVSRDGQAAAYNTLETLPINDCFSAPCYNQATCTPMEFGYVCHCPSGHTGQQCETEVNECESEPCYNNATCHNLINAFRCECPPGFTGSQCEVDINECDPYPCQNGASCINVINGFTCVCESGYTGETCDVDIDECAGSPCAAGATCQDLLNNFICVCPPGDTGRFCQTHINECESSPCLHGLCLDRANNFSCVCEAGYTGLTCEEDIDDCASSPCQHNSICTDLVNSFSCTCTPGYSGRFCEEEIPTDFMLEFPSAGILNYISVDGLSSNLSSASVCFWMYSVDRENYGTPFSYATQLHDNAFTITDYNGFVVYVNGEKRITDVRANDGLWHHVCVTWTSNNGSWAIYLDAEMRDGGSGLANGTSIDGSGVMVLGQEQDHRGGGYSPQESFVGHMTLANLWGERLSAARVHHIYTQCERYVGNVRAWPDFKAGIRGQITVKTSTFCRGCGVAFVPPNSKVIEQGSGPGAQVTITCNEGFKLYRGTAERVCLVHGNWSGEEPECRRVHCGFPGYLLNGHMEGHSYSYSDTISYICNPGFELRGEAERTCQADGKWSGEDPACEVVRCPHLNAGPNGEVQAPLYDYLPTNQISFKCETGYQMDGPSVLTCGGDGEWDGDAPSCLSNSCSSLPSIPHGYVEGEALVSPGGQAVVKCDFGYSLKGNAIITCLDDGSWSLPLPKCARPKCTKPPSVDHGTVRVRASMSSQEAVYKCDDGYVLEGSRILTCGEDGEWNAPWSTCVGLPCPAPFVPHHTTIPEKDTWRVGDVLEYQCEVGFKLEGSPFLSCSSNGVAGEWQGVAPQCTLVTCPTPSQLDNGAVHITHRPPPAQPARHHLILPEVRGEMELGRRRRRDLSFPSVGSSSDSFPSIGSFSDLEFPSVGSQTSKSSDPSWYPDHDYYGEFSQSPGSDFLGQSSDSDDYGQSTSDLWSQNTGQATSDYEDFSQSSNGLSFSQSSSSDFDYYGQTSQTSGGPSEGSELQLLDYPYSTVVEYDCRPGFTLLGASQRRCTESGDWNEPEPRCYEQHCSDLPTLSNGHIVYHGSGVDSRAEYVCDEGYSLQGEDYELLCQSDKVWLGEIPSCQLLDCGDPPDIGNGTLEFTSTTFGSVATYDCFFGFVLEGSVTRFCSGLGFWNGSLARCVAVTCSVPPVIDNGYITFEGNLYVDSPIEYECKECFRLNGTRIRHCQVDGTWTLEEPHCELIYCDALPSSIPNGQVIGSDNACGSLVEYECSLGYQLNGAQKATCLENERWSSPTPSCERMSCGLPGSPENGLFRGTSFLFTDKITYECDEGYILQGPVVQVCLADGSWSGPPPYCAIVNCTNLQWPSNGRIRLSGTSFGSYANIVCDAGYAVEGENNLMCNADGNWDNELPHCLPVLCPPAPQVDHAIYNSTERQFESFTVLEYRCDRGYETTVERYETALLTCSASGQWEPQTVECLPVNCGDPGTIPFGTIVGDNYTYGSEVQFICDDGYKLLGPSSGECQADGDWSNYAAACLQIICPPSGRFQFGTVVADDSTNTFGTTLAYNCNVGYFLEGSAYRNCSLDGEWTGSAPYCRPVTCPEPFQALNAMLEGEVYEYGHSVRYTCHNGYLMQGRAELVCQADGSWSTEAPICEMITCPDAPELLRGTWKVKSIEEHPIKAEPLSAKGRKGSSKGHRSAGSLAKLQTLLQESREEVLHRFGEIIEAECETGYATLSGSVLVCTEAGWNGQVPQCSAISCPIPIDIRRGRVTGNNYTFGGTITYQCNEGHDLVGEATRTCLASKEWSGTSPYCREVECPQPALLRDGQTQVESVKYGAIVSYQCDPGFRLDGLSSRMCQRDGYWTGEVPVCVELFCEMPTEVLHSVRDVVDLKVGGTVRYSCLEGYRLEGSGTLNCISEGTWDSAPPSCIQIDCGPPPSADNLLSQTSETTYGSQVSFQCERGYRLEGSEWATCLQSEQWSADAPWCEMILCPPPPVPSHGHVLSQLNEDDEWAEESNEFEVLPVLPQLGRGGKGKKGRKKGKPARLVALTYPVDAEVRWACDEGFQAEGVVTAVCRENGEWSVGPPRCSRVSCGPPHLPDHTTLHAPDFLYGATANYSCKEGHVMLGYSVLTCEGNGQWSSAPPSCPPISCGPASPPAFASVSYVPAEHHLPHSYGSTVFYTCVDGYKLVGNEYQVCEADGSWFGPQPHCEEKQCEATPYIPYGEAVLTEDDGIQTAIFSCLLGYNMLGTGVVQCYLGDWNMHNTTCDPINCFEPAIPAFGKIIAKHFTYGSVANYSCIYGYMLVGNPSVVCEADSTWEGGLPTCVPVDCGEPEKMSNGEVEASGTTLGVSIKYRCKPGYQLFGDQVRMCTSNATWSGNLPQCHRKDCGELEAPEKGFAMGGGTVYEDWVRFGCVQGYKLTGDDRLVCDESGNWSAPVPTCQPMKCESPSLPPNVLPIPERTWVYGERLTYSCKEGYISRGDLSVSCHHDGQFARVLGQCSKVSCGRPKISNDGAVIMGRSFYYGDKVVYRCPPGKMANGSSVLTCLETGVWSGEGGCTAVCGRRCLNGGVCLSNSKCTCPPGYVGNHCQHAVCVAPCLNGGTCVAPYKCRCQPGYTGHRCQTLLCRLPCLNGGVCSGPYRCTCLPGYAGARCQTPVCERGCGEGGRCIGPNTCHCRQGTIASSCNDSDDYEYSDYGVNPEEESRTYFEPSWDLGSFKPGYTRRRGWRY
ncbi:hypothetical protein Pmani_023017 [Petrolisthes manimaculis]|uniref:Sushi, von Willebrand factor type A, EGF and pentraxin domain-containing protein 1-like n=1 Tax=Petrolisthes manimaculis TaxID=1843537 RepID=A0AAE1U012_9EUCA|nr:hypothetical protein Pmani_023017 [Petrolisthes manimaculis]